MRSIVCAFALSVAAAAHASKPVKVTLAGCVEGGVFYDTRNDIAYPIATPASLDLAPLEGKALSITGWLSPGDRFELEGAPRVTAASCPAGRMRLIRHEQVVRLRVDATKAATAGDFALADQRLTEAFALVSPPDCDSYTDRAHVAALKGDVAAAGKDLATIKARKCYVPKGAKMNWLLLEDLGNALLAKGDKQGAALAMRLAAASK